METLNQQIDLSFDAHAFWKSEVITHQVELKNAQTVLCIAMERLRLSSGVLAQLDAMARAHAAAQENSASAEIA